MLAEDAQEEATKYSPRQNLRCFSFASPLLLPCISSVQSASPLCRCELEYRSAEASQFKGLADRLQAAPATNNTLGLISAWPYSNLLSHPIPRHIAPKSQEA